MTLVHRRARDSAERMVHAQARILASSSIGADVSCPVRQSNVGELAECDAIVLGPNTTDSLITPDVLKRDAVIVDIRCRRTWLGPFRAADRTSPPTTARWVDLPDGQALATDWMPLPKGQIYA
jgi:hypothetical protein